MKCEIVVFSPARRASRKLLERMVEVSVPGQLHVNAMLTCFCARSSYAYWGTSPLSTTKVQIAARLNTRVLSNDATVPHRAMPRQELRRA